MSGWRPIRGTAEGVLMPCGANPQGTVLEFFAHPLTAAELLSEPEVWMRDSTGGRRRYAFRLAQPAPYPSGDVQLQAHEVRL